jgi:hypothetical protein
MPTAAFENSFVMALAAFGKPSSIADFGKIHRIGKSKHFHISSFQVKF